MSSSPYFPFYPSDWLAGTRGMTAAETGIYITLIAMMYEREAPIDMPADRLARLCGATVGNFKKALGNLLMDDKLQMINGGIWNQRAQVEIEKRKSLRESAKANADTRWEKSKQNQRKHNATALNPQCETHANQNQNQNHIELETKVSRQDFAQEAFDLFSETALKAGLPKPQRMTAARKSSLNARLKECGGIDGWRACLDKIAASPYLRGDVRDFKATLDWVANPTNFTKIMEGNYDDRGGNNSQRGGFGNSGGAHRAGSGTVDAFIAVAARRGSGS